VNFWLGFGLGFVAATVWAALALTVGVRVGEQFKRRTK
jgi:hypothetical protein